MEAPNVKRARGKKRNPLTAAEGKRQRKELLRDVERDLRAKARAKLAELRAKLRQLQAARASALRVQVERCKAEREAAKARAKEMRRRALEDLRAAIAAERLAAKTACSSAKHAARVTSKSDIERARAELLAEQRYQRDLRRIEQANAVQKRETRKRAATGHERRSESDDEVRANIPAEYAALWERVKRSIKGDTRQTRTEAFLKYAEEHPGEVLASIDDKTDAAIAELLEKQRAVEPYARPRRKRYTEAELAAVPF